MGMEPAQTIRIAPVQVTVWGSTKDRDLMSWFTWYKNRKTPAAVVRDNRRGGGNIWEDHSASVWRYGKDTGEFPDKWRDSYEIVEECRGFTRLLTLENRSTGKEDR